MKLVKMLSLKMFLHLKTWQIYFTRKCTLPFKVTAVKTLSAYCSLIPGFISRSSDGSGGGPSGNIALLERPRAGTLAPSGLFLASCVYQTT